MKNRKNQRSKGTRKPDKLSNKQRDIESLDMREGRVPLDTRKAQADSKKDNDWQWYAHNEQLLRDVASFSYSWPTGAELNIPSHRGLDSSSIPGIMAFYLNPAVGFAASPMSPLNTAARNIYSFVRHANAGHSNYDAPDLMLYLLAMDSAYSLVSFMKRAYGLLSVFTYENRYYSDAILTANRLDPDDFRMHMADFRAFINTYAVRIGSMCIPSSMSYMARHMWMYENVYLDSDTAKAQTYLYAPNAFYKFGLDTEGNGMLQYTRFSRENDTPWTFKLLAQFALDLIEPILSSEDCNIMSGDILKAFGADGVFKLVGIPENYQCLPTYSPEVQSQIENLTMMGNVVDDTTYDPTINYTPNVYQVVVEGGSTTGIDAWLKSKPNFTPLQDYRNQINNITQSPSAKEAVISAALESQIMSAFTSDRFVNFHHDDVTPADAMVATRLTNMLVQDLSVENVVYYSETLGSEYVTHAAVFWYSYNVSTHNTALNYLAGITSNLHADTYRVGLTGANPPDQTQWQLITQRAHQIGGFSDDAAHVSARYKDILSQFDWHPGFYTTFSIVTVPVVNGNIQYPVEAYDSAMTQFIFEDIDRYTIMNARDLAKLSEVALLSEFSVPQMGTFSRKFG